MTSVSVVNLFICTNVLLAAAVLLIGGMRLANRHLREPFTYRQQTALAYSIIVAAVSIPLIVALRGEGGAMPLTAQVWSGPVTSALAAKTEAVGQLSLSTVSTAAQFPLSAAGNAFLFIVALGALIWLMQLVKHAAATVAAVRGAALMRRVGNVRVLASDVSLVPFSIWVPGSHYIVVPTSLIAAPGALRMAIAHEGEHHRRGDTKVLYLMQLIRALFFWNPAVHALDRQLSELQEFSCDEAIKQRKPALTDAYCRCLMRVAQRAREARPLLCANMSGASERGVLKRRVEAMLAPPRFNAKRAVVCAAAAVALLILGVAGSAFSQTIRDHRISLDQAKAMAASIRTSFPIEVNAGVLDELNRMLATPEGRTWLIAGVQRMKEHRELIASNLSKYGLPSELLAIPLVESAYRNLAQSGESNQHGAGLWMFIKPTAIAYGLRVDDDVDERLNVAVETDAAMRMLKTLYSQYGDWGLALLAYNAGSRRVDAGIRDTGSRSVWELVREGYENDRGYVPRVMAAALILSNPSVLE